MDSEQRAYADTICVLLIVVLSWLTPWPWYVDTAIGIGTFLLVFAISTAGESAYETERMKQRSA